MIVSFIEHLLNEFFSESLETQLSLMIVSFIEHLLNEFFRESLETQLSLMVLVLLDDAVDKQTETNFVNRSLLPYRNQ